MKYRVTHSNAFSYHLPVISSQQVLRLKPREIFGRQSLLSHDIKLSVQGTEILEIQDYFGNTVHEVRLHTRHQKLQIDSVAEVEILPRDEILLDLSPAWENVREAMAVPETTEHWQAAQFCYPSRHVKLNDALQLAQQFAEPGKPLLRLILDLNQYIYREFRYTGGVTDVNTEVAEVLSKRVGVCQDFAHVAIAATRALGLPARYVSGYILSQVADQPALVGAEASHAWISVYCPEFGWVDFDPTNNQITSEQHVTLGWGRDYADVAPTRGSILGGGKQSLSVDVKVRIIN